MQELVPEYLAEIARQIGFISAFLGGIAATLMSVFLQRGRDDRTQTWAVITAAGAAIAFIVAVVATTLLVVVSHPAAPQQVASAAHSAGGRLLAFIPFVIGIYLLLGCIGLSGFIQSRRVGLFTSVSAAVGIFLVSYLITG